MTAKIVVTAFELWEHETENLTLEICGQLDSFNDLESELITMRLPVGSTKLDELVDEMMEQVRPDLWISLGLSPRLSVMGMERVAGNVLDSQQSNR